MVCASCGTENEAGRKFCKECAARLALVCPACGAANSDDAKFCGDCAAPLVAGATPSPSRTARPGLPTASAAPVAERRLVSILFADLVGFTTLAEGRDAEETRELLSRYFELSRDVIGRYGGTVEKFIGDAVMAVWGAPVAHEDDAERAVRAGLELVVAVRTLGPSIQARAGVLTGEAAVTLGARGEGMVAGDLVNTASRLQSVAPPGAVLVGEATRQASSRAIAFEPAGEQTLKGKASPVSAWRALRVVAERGGRGRSDGLEAPFVGRDEELHLLKDLFHATGRERRARLVSVTGIGGIGKTRLAWEFGKYVDGLIEPIWRHEGRSPAYGEGITFWALGEMVRRRCGLLETDDERTTRTKVAEVLARHVPDLEERGWIEPALLTLLGVDSGMSSEQLFGAWRMFFERLAATGTVVMVFEDLQWADPGLLDFIDALLEWSRPYPILVLTLARPELLERRPDWGAGKRSFTSIFLEPLPAAVMRELLAGLVPGLPEAAGKAIVERADGVPLYAVETVRMLLGEGKLALKGGFYQPVGDLATLAVPATLAALIASRLDGLEPVDRGLLCDAAVLGHSFTLAALAAVSGIDEPELEPRLRGLVRGELLTLDTDPRSPERGQYAFVQALVREVAYNTLARRDLKARHLAAARYFESLGSDELAGALAGHYLAAHRNAPEGAEADAVAAQARIALSAAAERAITLGSNAQAVALLEQVLSVTTDPAEQALLLERAGQSASLAADHEAAERFLVRAIDTNRGLGDRSAVARTIAALGAVLMHGARYDRALEILEPATAEFSDFVGDPGAIALDSQLARALMLSELGESQQRAVDIADRALAAAERGDLVAIVADTLITRGSALCGLRRAYEGIGAMRAGIDLARVNGFTAIAGRGLGNLSVWLGDSDLRGELEASRAALALGARVGDRAGHALSLSNATHHAVDTGDWDWAQAENQAAMETAPGELERASLMKTRLMIGSLRGEDLAAEARWLERFLAGSDERQLREEVFEARFWVAFGAGRLSDAYDAATTHGQIYTAEATSAYPYAAICALWERDRKRAIAALAALDSTGAHGRVVDMNRRTIQAGLAALEGRSDDALAGFREALAGWRDLGSPWREALTAITMATLLEPADPEVRAAAVAAREILVRLQAVPFTARLDAAMARTSAPERSTAGMQELAESGAATPPVTTR